MEMLMFMGKGSLQIHLLYVQAIKGHDFICSLEGLQIYKDKMPS